VAVTPASTARGDRLPVAFTFRPSAGDYRKGWISEISPHDAMPVDDVAYGKVPAGDKLPVYFAGASPSLERALVSDPMVDLHTGAVAAISALDQGMERENIVGRGRFEVHAPVLPDCDA